MKGDKWVCIEDLNGITASVKRGFVLTEGDDNYVYYDGEIVCGIDSVSGKKYLIKLEVK